MDSVMFQVNRCTALAMLRAVLLHYSPSLLPILIFLVRHC